MILDRLVRGLGNSDAAGDTKTITGEGEARKKEIIAFAASLGYELECIGNMREITLDEMENVAGGTPPKIPRQKGLLYGQTGTASRTFRNTVTAKQEQRLGLRNN